MPKDWATKYLATQHQWINLLDPSAVPPIDIFPFLKWIPAAFAPWKRQAEHARKGLSEAYTALVDHASQSKDYDHNGPKFESLVERLLRQNQSLTGEEPDLNRRDVAFIVGGVLDGAFDTVYHTSLTILKILAAYPAVQERIQTELDEAWYAPKFLSPPALWQPPRLPEMQHTLANFS